MLERKFNDGLEVLKLIAGIEIFPAPYLTGIDRTFLHQLLDRIGQPDLPALTRFQRFR